MKNSEYWKNRFKQLEEAQNHYSQKAYTEIEQLYRTAQKQIEKDIRAWYQRFADNNQISLSEARQWISSNALKEFKWDVQEYIKYGKDNAVSGQWMKQLENVSAKFHISKLEMLKIQTQQSMEELFMKQHGIVNSTMSDVFKSGYYHTAYELQKGFSVGWEISGLNQSYVEKLLSKPWAADKYNFSDRIWSSKDKLINNIHTELTQNIMLGEDPQKAIDALSKQMATSKYNAGRLVQTEQAYFSQLAQGECFSALGVEKYEIVEALDSHTCDICGAYDGQVFDMTDYNPGVTAPPWHPNCRGTTCPYFDDKFDIGKRAARDENGNTYYVPDNMAYKEWKSVFVDGGDKSELDQTIPVMDTLKFEDGNAANAYFGKRADNSLRRTNREEYNRQREAYKNSSYGKWSEALTDKQYTSIAHYAGDDYVSINGLLRSQMTENQVKHWDSVSASGITTMEYIESITSAISEFELKDNIQVYRTCEMDVFRSLKKEIGSIFMDDAFTSTSVLTTPVASGNVRMVIDIPADKGVGAWIAPISGMDDEYEFLLQRGTQFRIDSIDETGTDVKIHMTVVGNDPKTDFSYASKEDVIKQWKEDGIYFEDNVKFL